MPPYHFTTSLNNNLFRLLFQTILGTFRRGNCRDNKVKKRHVKLHSAQTLTLKFVRISSRQILFFEAAFFKLGILKIVWTARECNSVVAKDTQLQVQHYTRACDVFQQYIIVTQ